MDKLILSLISQGVEVIITVNKTDLKHDIFNEISLNFALKTFTSSAFMDISNLFKINFYFYCRYLTSFIPSI